MLFSPGTHFLTYENIGEGCAVTKIDIKENLDDDLNPNNLNLHSA